jgi:2-beta-glucuronyltransferase
MKQVLFLSGHLFMSKRHANFHHLAKACSQNGNSVTFCTVPNSLITLLIQNHNKLERLKSYFYAFFPMKQNGIHVTSYISLMYPLNKGSKLNSLFMWLFQYGYSKTFQTEYDVIIIENGIPLLLFEKLKQLNPSSKFVYRVSDPIEKNMGWEGFLEFENRIVDQFDMVSTPTSSITERLREQYPSVNIETHYHGINKELFSKDYANPYLKYSAKKINFVFVGASKMDFEFLDIASTLLDDYIFHIIGPFEHVIQKENIIYYGEMKFEETIQYIKYADICLQTLVPFTYSDLYERPLKFTQYSFFKKPILSPEHMNLKDKNAFSYLNTADSIQYAINEACKFDSLSFEISWIKSWNEIAKELCI